MTGKPVAPATDRNRDAILAVLLDEFADAESVLEIGSGTGQHATYFAARLPGLTWQTSDRVENHSGICAWVDDASSANVRPPLELDVTDCALPDGKFDAVFSANTAHIMTCAAVECMFGLVGQLLPAGGVFCLYGPFNIDGEFTSLSNERFHQSLQSRDPAMGIRDLESLVDLAAKNGLSLDRRYAMPSNNLTLVWHKE
jgi:cyclopropane fatty-acyl-phospholipid synthase-like methyltransferase